MQTLFEIDYDSGEEDEASSILRKAAAAIKENKIKNIITLAGAGISTSCGIPELTHFLYLIQGIIFCKYLLLTAFDRQRLDYITLSPITSFISISHNIYNISSYNTQNLEKYNLDEPEDIFTLSYFKSKPQPFFTLSKELVPNPLNCPITPR